MFCLILISTLAALTDGELFCTQPSIPMLDGKIVGGRKTTIEEYPYQVSFQMYDRHYCGGSLIFPDVVITAAHCTEHYELLHKMDVRAGSTFKERDGQVVHVKSICTHPKYDSKTGDYDVSVLHLDKSLSLSDKVQTISLQPTNEEIPDGTSAVVTGWGGIYSGGPGSEILQEVVVPKVNDNQCDKYYYHFPITNRMHCFGYEKGGKDSCQGDSGGPLVVNGNLAGIVSWGVGCAEPRKPGVYTKVSHPKIVEHINKCVTDFRRNYIRINSYENNIVK